MEGAGAGDRVEQGGLVGGGGAPAAAARGLARVHPWWPLVAVAATLAAAAAAARLGWGRRRRCRSPLWRRRGGLPVDGRPTSGRRVPESPKAARATGRNAAPRNVKGALPGLSERAGAHRRMQARPQHLALTIHGPYETHGTVCPETRRLA
eukprot:TRINITY_DN19778_c0_g1_i1.p2 TRINITY_DN19778_c0_g1~~TRINITY_DN19778_c0_g1_i1.p2  ORF type:complete len:151 (-),score=6.36 TRINITY_DN19778_c0_g1_i1:27-479(-)